MQFESNEILGALDIARERDALATRVRIVEAALACIERETDLALEEPDVAFIVTRRVASIARQAL